jgi:hypothetical protein
MFWMIQYLPDCIHVTVMNMIRRTEDWLLMFWKNI